MDYKNMWEELKVKIEKDLEYHINDEMQSLAEAVQGMYKCKEFLRYMKELEDKYNT